MDITERDHPLNDEYRGLCAAIEGTEDVSVLKAALKAMLGVPGATETLWRLNLTQEQILAHTVPTLADFEDLLEPMVCQETLFKGMRAALAGGQAHPCFHCHQSFPVEVAGDEFRQGYVKWSTDPFRSVLDRDQTCAWRCGSCVEKLDQAL